jgi:hypothetical protein
VLTQAGESIKKHKIISFYLPHASSPTSMDHTDRRVKCRQTSSATEVGGLARQSSCQEAEEGLLNRTLQTEFTNSYNAATSPEQHAHWRLQRWQNPSHVMQQVADLHPAADAPSAEAPNAVPEQITRQQLMQVLKRLPTGSAPGPSGWTYEHTQAVENGAAQGMDAVLNFVNSVLAGDMPEWEELRASRLIPLRKKCNGVRPIAIHCLRSESTTKVESLVKVLMDEQLPAQDKLLLLREPLQGKCLTLHVAQSLSTSRRHCTVQKMPLRKQ